MAADDRSDDCFHPGGRAAAAGGGGGGGGGAEEESQDKIEKKIRNVEKKLRQIGELKELVAGGKTLESNQLDKIKNEAAVQEELAGLQAKLKTTQESGKWR